MSPRLKAFDGTPLARASITQLAFSTSSLSMYSGGVTSALAEQATDGAWQVVLRPHPPARPPATGRPAIPRVVGWTV